MWQEKRPLLITLGVLFLANLLFFLTYRVRYQERIDDMHDKLHAAEATLEQARKDRAEKQNEMAAYREVVKTINTVYDDLWSTPEKRLTPLLVEIHRLAAKAGIKPQGYSYSSPPAMRGAFASPMGISFNVSGTYSQVRNLINLFELSRQFLIIDSIALSNSSGDPSANGAIALNIHLTTLFKEKTPPTPSETRGAGNE